MKPTPDKTRRTIVIALLAGGTGLAVAVALLILPEALDVLGALPWQVWIGLMVVTLVAGGAFASHQLRAMRLDRRLVVRRSTGAVSLTQGIGTAHEVLDAKPMIDVAAREAFEAHAARLRLPPAPATGKLVIDTDGPIEITQPISAGNDVKTAMKYAAIEDVAIRTSIDVTRDLINHQFNHAVPSIVHTFAGAHYDAGTTAARTLAFQGDALSWPGAEYSILHLLHTPVTGTPAWAKAEKEAEKKEPSPDPGTQKLAPRKIRFLVPRPARSVVKLVDAASAPGSAPQRPGRLQASFPLRTRADLILRSLVHWSHGAISLVRAESATHHKRVDQKLREATAITEVVAQLGTTDGSGIETRRLARELGCGFIGSFSDQVYAVGNQASLPGLVATLGMSGVRTLEGFVLHPGDADDDQRHRRVVLFAYGEPSLVKEIPEHVRDALELNPEEFFHCAAGILGMVGAKFCLFVEASAEEVEGAYPYVSSHPAWPVFQEAVSRWNDLKGDGVDIEYAEEAGAV